MTIAATHDPITLPIITGVLFDLDVPDWGGIEEGVETGNTDTICVTVGWKDSTGVDTVSEVEEILSDGLVKELFVETSCTVDVDVELWAVLLGLGVGVGVGVDVGV